MIDEEIRQLKEDDPLTLQVFLGEYYFLKKDLEKAYSLFSEAFEDPGLNPILRETVRNYLVVASRELRKKAIEGMEFTISFEAKEADGTQHHYVIGKDTFNSQTAPVGMLLEVLNYHLNKLPKTGM
jgi:hypothetical protein